MIPQGVQTLREWLGEDGITVERELAQQRAEVCKKCPHNTEGNALLGAAAEAVKRHVEFKNKVLLRVDGEKSLGLCDICGCYLKTKIWIPINLIRRHMPAGEWEKFPSPCFQRDEKI